MNILPEVVATWNGKSRFQSSGIAWTYSRSPGRTRRLRRQDVKTRAPPSDSSILFAVKMIEPAPTKRNHAPPRIKASDETRGIELVGKRRWSIPIKRTPMPTAALSNKKKLGKLKTAACHRVGSSSAALSFSQRLGSVTVNPI
jgi:hypothetical protein